MHRTRLGLVAVAACLLAGTSAAAVEPAPVQLAGTTTITATSAAASTVVRLARDVTLSGTCLDDPAVSVSGTADAVLVALQPLDGGRPQHLGRLPQRQGGSTFSSLCGPEATLAAGSYLLTLLRSPGTAVVSLRLPGLPGRSAVRARTPSSAVLRDLSPVPTYAATSGTAQSFAATHDLTSTGALAVVGWVDQGGPAVLAMGACDKRRSADADAVADAVDFAPGCPTGGSSSSLPSARGEGVSYLTSTYSGIEAGSWGSGFYYVSSGPVLSAGALAAWLPLEG